MQECHYQFLYNGGVLSITALELTIDEKTTIFTTKMLKTMMTITDTKIKNRGTGIDTIIKLQ